MTEILRRKQDLCPPFTPIICRGSGSTSRQSLTCLPQKRTEGLLPGERPGSLLARRLGSEAAGKAREKDVAAAQRAHRVLLSPHLCTANQTLVTAQASSLPGLTHAACWNVILCLCTGQTPTRSSSVTKAWPCYRPAFRPHPARNQGRSRRQRTANPPICLRTCFLLLEGNYPTFPFIFFFK